MRNWLLNAFVVVCVVFCVAENAFAQSKKVEFLTKDSVLYESVREVDSLIVYQHPRLVFDFTNVRNVDSSITKILNHQNGNKPCFGKKRNARLIDDYINSVYVFFNYSDFRLLKEVEAEKSNSANSDINKKVVLDGNNVSRPTVQPQVADKVTGSSSTMETVNDKKETASSQTSDTKEKPKPEMTTINSTKTVENWSVFYEPVAIHRYLEKYLGARERLLKRYRYGK